MKLFSCAAIFVYCLLAVRAHAQPIQQTVFFDLPENLAPDPIPPPTQQLLNVAGYPDDPSRLTIIARLALPDPAIHGPGPYPTVLFLHGSGGLWSNDVIPDPISETSMSSQFRDWENLLVSEGFACLFPDSYNPRGIAGNFSNRRPSHDQAVDDALCSPNYERPKDVVASLAYLASRSDIDRDNIALIGFSHGSQTGMNALVDVSVDLGNYEVSYIDLVDDGMGGQVESTVDLPVAPPVRIPPNLPIPKFCAFYYGGGSHYGYHGQASSVAAGRYMLDRRTTAILFHGTADSLMGISDINATPVTGSVYPMKQVLSSAAQASSLGVQNPIRHHYILDRCVLHQPASERVNHSFDTVDLAVGQDWDTVNESPDQKAKRLARDIVLRWLDFSLRPPPVVSLAHNPGPPASYTIEWTTRGRLAYRLLKSTDGMHTWPEAASLTNGTGIPMIFNAPDENHAFFKVAYETQSTPENEPENTGFFLDYADFGL